MSLTPDSWPPRTVWRLVAFRGPDSGRRDVELEVVVDSVDPEVLEAIEAAASAHGVELVRVGEAD